MSFYHAKGFNPDWKDNQGFINAMIERLYKQNKDKMKEYAATLTQDQRDQARSHLQTVLKLEGSKDD